MKLSERSIKIKELIHNQVDMGTFGLVELELIEFDKEIQQLKILNIPDVSNNEAFSEVVVCDHVWMQDPFRENRQYCRECLKDRII